MKNPAQKTTQIRYTLKKNCKDANNYCVLLERIHYGYKTLTHAKYYIFYQFIQCSSV